MCTLVKQLSCPLGEWQIRKETCQVYNARTKSGFALGFLEFTESLDLFVSLINTSWYTTINADALNECDPSNGDGFLHSLTTIGTSPSSLVKISVPSRDDTDTVLQLEGVLNLAIEATNNQKDIQRFVIEEVTRRIKHKELLQGNVSKQLEETIIDCLTTGLDGTYKCSIFS